MAAISELPIGQDGLLLATVGAHHRGRLAHAQLLIGRPGAGRGRIAEVLTQAQFCQTPDPRGLPCQACATCRSVANGTHPDLHWTDASGKLGIDEARALSHAAALAPVNGPCRVFVVEACERLTEPAAAALLKTLEDPPGPVLFLFLTDAPDRLEPTLRSRCQPVRLRPVPAATIAGWLSALRPDLPAQVVEHAAAACGGLPGIALSLVEGTPGTDLAVDGELSLALVATEPGEIVARAAALATAGVGPEAALGLLRALFVARMTCGGDLGGLAPPAALLAAWPPVAVAAAVPACLSALDAVQANVNPSLNWQVLLIRLREARRAC